jgi:hypothetical protein
MVTNTRAGWATKRTGPGAWSAYGAYKRAEKLTPGELRRRFESLIADDAAGCSHGPTTWAEMSRQLHAAAESADDSLTPGQRSQLLDRALDSALRARKAARQ